MAGDRICGMSACSFVAVVQVTSKPQIVNVGTAAGRDRDDVLDMKPFGGESPRGQTIATTLMGVFFNLSLDVLGHIEALWRHAASLDWKRLAALG